MWGWRNSQAGSCGFFLSWGHLAMFLQPPIYTCDSQSGPLETHTSAFMCVTVHLPIPRRTDVHPKACCELSRDTGSCHLGRDVLKVLVLSRSSLANGLPKDQPSSPWNCCFSGRFSCQHLCYRQNNSVSEQDSRPWACQARALPLSRIP